jgi:hypothetical protein
MADLEEKRDRLQADIVRLNAKADRHLQKVKDIEEEERQMHQSIENQIREGRPR